MKATLEFNLPEDNEEYRDCIDGWKYKLVLQNFTAYLRRKLDTDLPDDVYSTYERVQNDICEMINEAEISIY